MAKVTGLRNLGVGPITMYAFHCPGCGYDHAYLVNDYQRPNAPVWEFNEDVDKPTFRPSLLVWGSDNARRCHLFVTDGKIQYCDDCFHDMRGLTVDMEDV